MENHFKGFIVEYIERNRNTKADELVKVVAHNMPLPVDVFFLVIMIKLEPRLINAIEREYW
jgi:hypothetical protein